MITFIAPIVLETVLRANKCYNVLTYVKLSDAASEFSISMQMPDHTALTWSVVFMWKTRS